MAVEWTTHDTQDLGLLTRGDEGDDYGSVVEADFGLFIGSGSGDGLIIEGSAVQLRALLRKLLALFPEESVAS